MIKSWLRNHFTRRILGLSDKIIIYNKDKTKRKIITAEIYNTDSLKIISEIINVDLTIKEQGKFLLRSYLAMGRGKPRMLIAE